MQRPLDYLLLAAAGGIGVLLRVGCTMLAVRLAGPGTSWAGWAGPAATLGVNVAGSFLFASVYALGSPRLGLSPAGQTILLVGLLGGFTTYSSFAFQSVELLVAGRLAAAFAYIAATNLLAVAATWAGFKLAGG